MPYNFSHHATVCNMLSPQLDFPPTLPTRFSLTLFPLSSPSHFFPVPHFHQSLTFPRAPHFPMTFSLSFFPQLLTSTSFSFSHRRPTLPFPRPQRICLQFYSPRKSCGNFRSNVFMGVSKFAHSICYLICDSQ